MVQRQGVVVRRLIAVFRYTSRPPSTTRRSIVCARLSGWRGVYGIDEKTRARQGGCQLLYERAESYRGGAQSDFLTNLPPGAPTWGAVRRLRTEDGSPEAQKGSRSMSFLAASQRLECVADVRDSDSGAGNNTARTTHRHVSFRVGLVLHPRVLGARDWSVSRLSRCINHPLSRGVVVRRCALGGIQTEEAVNRTAI